MLQINASIVKHKRNIYCAYRTTNLFQYDSVSYLSKLNAKLDVVSDCRLIAGNKNTAFEDVRLFSHGDELLAFYTYLPLNDIQDWKWEFGVGYGYVNLETGVIERQHSLRKLAIKTHEKNWVPYEFGGNIFMITDFSPFLRVIQIKSNNQSKEVYFSNKRSDVWEYGEIRGGTPLLKCPHSAGPWYYGFIHSSLQNHLGFTRYYYYTIVRYNHEEKKVEYYPVPFDLEEEEITEEYSLLWDYSNKQKLKVIFPIGIMHFKDGLMVSFGKDDVTSCTRYFSWKSIFKLFKST